MRVRFPSPAPILVNKGDCELSGCQNSRVITESHNKSPKISHVAECKSCPGSCRGVSERTDFVMAGFCVAFVPRPANQSASWVT
jgi:hypothetical protein